MFAETEMYDDTAQFGASNESRNLRKRGGQAASGVGVSSGVGASGVG